MYEMHIPLKSDSGGLNVNARAVGEKSINENSAFLKVVRARGSVAAMVRHLEELADKLAGTAPESDGAAGPIHPEGLISEVGYWANDIEDWATRGQLAIHRIEELLP